MCNTSPSPPPHPPPPPPSSLAYNSHLLNPTETPLDPILHPSHVVLVVQDHQEEENVDQDGGIIRRWPTPSQVVEEMRGIGKISIPTALTGLVLYSRSMISMLFLGYLGNLELAGGALSIGFANITGYSILSGLAMGMEPICGQAFGAKQRNLMLLTLQRTILLLLSASVPISVLWLNVRPVLLWCGQDAEISSVASLFLACASPDLFLLSFLQPLRVYLRTQNITLPLTYCSAASVVLHVPLNYLLVVHFRMGVAGVALAMVWTNLNLLLFLLLYVAARRGNVDDDVAATTRWGREWFRGWPVLLRLALPTCASVCLEWWWYELMILLCGLLPNPKATVASMGILIQTTALVYVFPSSLGIGVSTRVGNELGANRPTKARVSCIVAVALSLALGLAAMSFTASVRHHWGKLFTSDPDVLALTALALPIAGLCELGNCPQTTGCGVLRGSARPTVGANINFAAFYLVGMPVAMLLAFVGRVGFAGLWLGMLAAQVTCAVMMLLVLVRVDWTAEARRATQLTKPVPSPGTDSDAMEDKIDSADLQGDLDLDSDLDQNQVFLAKGLKLNQGQTETEKDPLIDVYPINRG